MKLFKVINTIFHMQKVYKIEKNTRDRLKFKKIVATKKKTNFKCCCKENLDELIPNEYYLCPKCDIIFNKRQVLNIMKKPNLQLKDLFINMR